tara:strand:- start:113 stop:670 length:558 start_codon:yes stop_codon:yes gene_type:complete
MASKTELTLPPLMPTTPPPRPSKPIPSSPPPIARKQRAPSITIKEQPQIIISRLKSERHKPPNKLIIYNAILETLKEKVSNISIRPSTLYLIIKYVMEEIENTPTKGVEQKEMALKLIRELIIDLAEGEDEKVLLQLLDDNTIGSMIDLIVDASKGKLNINAISNVGAGIFNNCIPPFCSSKNKS